MVRSIDVGYGAGTHMAARFVLDKVDLEELDRPANGIGAYESFVHSSQHPAGQLPRYSSGCEVTLQRDGVPPSQDLNAVLRTASSGEHWHQCN